MQGKSLIKRFDLESVVVDSTLNRFKKPQLVLKPELELAPRRPFTGSRPPSRLSNRRQVLLIHVKDKANELEKLYLDIFSPTQEIADTVPRNSVSCSHSECSLVFRHWKGEPENRQKTLMVRFQTSKDLEIVLGELKASGVDVEDSSRATQGLARLAVHPQLQHLVVVDQSSVPLPIPLVHQQSFYHGSPPLVMSPGAQDRYYTPPPSALHQSVFLRPPSQPVTHYMNMNAQSTLPSWTNPPRPATTTGIPGIIGEGIYKVSRVGSSSSSRSRGRKLDSIPESQGLPISGSSEHFDRTLERAEGLSKKRPLRTGDLPALQADERRAELAKALGKKYSRTGQSISSRVGSSLDTDTYTFTGSSTSRLSTAGEYYPATLSRPTKVLENGNSGSSTLAFTESPATCSQPALKLPGSNTHIPNLMDKDEPADNSPQVLKPPLLAEGEWVMQQFSITQEGLTEATKGWNELMERGQMATESIEELQEVQKIWAVLCKEWVKHLESTVATTVRKLKDVRRECARE